MSFIDDLYTKAKTAVVATATKITTGATAATIDRVSGLYKKMETGAIAEIDNTIKSLPRIAVAKPPPGTAPGANALAPAAAAGAASLPAWAIPAAVVALILGAILLNKGK